MSSANSFERTGRCTKGRKRTLCSRSLSITSFAIDIMLIFRIQAGGKWSMRHFPHTPGCRNYSRAFEQLHPVAHLQSVQLQDGPHPQTPSPQPQAPSAQLHPLQQVFDSVLCLCMFSLLCEASRLMQMLTCDGRNHYSSPTTVCAFACGSFSSFRNRASG